MNILSRPNNSELSVGTLIKNGLGNSSSPALKSHNVSFLWSNFTNISNFPIILILLWLIKKKKKKMGQDIREYFTNYHHPVVGQQDVQRGRVELRYLLQVSGPKLGLWVGF